MKKFFAIIILLLLFTTGYSQIVLDKKNIDDYISECMARWNIPGLSIAVIENGNITYLKGYGVRESGKQDKVDENTLFAVASNSKAFTGLSIALLESQDKLKLDDKVSKYIPYLKMNDETTTKLLSIKDVMTHRVGIGTFHGDFITWGTNYSSIELIKKLEFVIPNYDLRNGYGYFNSGYTIAGEIIKNLTGKTWSEYVRENILNPLEMNRTLVSTTELNNFDNIATPHTYDYNYKMVPIKWRNVDNLAPAGGLISSASDMAKWILMQINDGKYNDKEIFPKKLILRTHTPFNLIPSPSHGIGSLSNRHFRTYGLGWGIADYKGELFLEHSGGYDGMVSRTAFLPDKKFGLVILTNNDQNEVITSLMYQLFDYALGKEEFNWDTLIFNRSTKNGEPFDKIVWNEIRDKKDPSLKPNFEMTSLTGKYFNEQAGEIYITNENNELTLKMSSRPEINAVLKHWRNDTLICKFDDLVVNRCLAPVKFENGKIVSIKIKASDFIDPLYYEFIKKD